MRQVRLWVMLAAMGLAACGGEARQNSTGAGQLGLFDWKRDPQTLVVRLDSRPLADDPAFLLNSIPPCTLWGDGRVVWSTLDQYGSEEILEGRATDAAIRAFLEDIIARGFYEWEDELVFASESTPVLESITVSLYDEVHTVRRYSYWPQNSFALILEKCQQLSDSPVRVLPTAGWVSAYRVPRNPSAPTWLWPANAPFTLAELADSQEERWLEGPLATEVWLNARERRGDVQVIERTGDAYQVAIVVPGYSRDALAPPTESASGS